MKEITIEKIRQASNKMVYQWKREFNKAIESGGEIPRAITIPKIAKRAGIAPKTIYTNDEYKSIAQIAIAKTTIIHKYNDLDFNSEKNSYTKEELYLIIKDYKNKKQMENETLTRKLLENELKLSKLKNENTELIRNLEEYAFKIIEVENENELLKSRIRILNFDASK